MTDRVLQLQRFASPVGEILLVTDEQQRVRALDFHDYAERMHKLLGSHYGIYQLRETGAGGVTWDALEAYFAGDVQALDALVTYTAGSAFQLRVWAALRQVPYGNTSTYGALAQQLGCPKGARAVGLANGANPIAIIVPCHRLIGANGALTGFAGGLQRKRWLLEHEQRHAPQRSGQGQLFGGES